MVDGDDYDEKEEKIQLRINGIDNVTIIIADTTRYNITKTENVNKTLKGKDATQQTLTYLRYIALSAEYEHYIDKLYFVRSCLSQCEMLCVYAFGGS